MVIVTDGYFDWKENEIAKEIIFFFKMSAFLEFIYESTHCKEKYILQLQSTKYEINKFKTKDGDAIELKLMINLIFSLTKEQSFSYQKTPQKPKKHTSTNKKILNNNLIA